jgi:hypothetical protein
LCQAQPGEIEFDRVLLVVVREFIGHVYNLTTRHGYFASNGYYVGNTEIAAAYNRSHYDGIVEMSKDMPMMMRWCEHVDDDTYMPLDLRVGIDSIAMHGQVAPAGGLFVMPPTAPDGTPVSGAGKPWSLIGMSWPNPPNRPNDRAVLQPWLPTWGVPGWQWRGGRRVPVTIAPQPKPA